MVRRAENLSSPGRGHAVVAGAGMAGLLAAVVLAEFFEQVTIVERDDIPEGARPRRGVPQGRHSHALLPRGLAALENLFPGFAAEVVRRGALAADAARQVSWGLGGSRLCAAPGALPVIVSTRPFLEDEVRRRVTAVAHIALRTSARVSDFVLEGGRVTAVVVEQGDSGASERLDADLVVDATGRASRLPAWLRQHGFEPAAEEAMDVDVGYATARFKADPGRLGGLRVLLVGATPGRPRSGVVTVVEGGMIEVSLIGYRGEHPPANLPGFVAHAGSLALPDIHRLIHDAEPCSDIALFGVARTVRRHYHKLDRLPQGIVAVGDAMCAFNPVFAQGMTVAALEALALRSVLRQAATGPRHADLVRRFYRQAARELEPAWRMARGNDLMVPYLAPRASVLDRLMSRWIKRVLAVGSHDPQVARRFLRVASLVDPPQALFAPTIMLRVLLARRDGAAITAPRQDSVAARPGADAFN